LPQEREKEKEGGRFGGEGKREERGSHQRPGHPYHTAIHVMPTRWRLRREGGKEKKRKRKAFRRGGRKKKRGKGEREDSPHNTVYFFDRFHQDFRSEIGKGERKKKGGGHFREGKEEGEKKRGEPRAAIVNFLQFNRSARGGKKKGKIREGERGKGGYFLSVDDLHHLRSVSGHFARWSRHRGEKREKKRAREGGKRGGKKGEENDDDVVDAVLDRSCLFVVRLQAERGKREKEVIGKRGGRGGGGRKNRPFRANAQQTP